jgi:hypothetical protein
MSLKNNIDDISKVSSRYGVGSVFIRTPDFDGQKIIFKCSHVDSILQFMTDGYMYEADRTDIKYANEFSQYEDGFIMRDDLEAFDQLLVSMFLTGDDCITLQGGLGA